LSIPQTASTTDTDSLSPSKLSLCQPLRKSTALPEPILNSDPTASLASLFENHPLLTLPQSPEPTVIAENTPPAEIGTLPDATTPPDQPAPTEPPEPPRPPAPKYSPGQSLQFIGSILSGETRRAWFVDRRSGDEHFAAVSEDVSVPELTVKVLALTDDSVTVLYKTKRVRLKLGQTVALPAAAVSRKTTSLGKPRKLTLHSLSSKPRINGQYADRFDAP
jgi:hypothetical protein